MKTLNQRGAINVLVIPLALLILFFLAAASFGYWAFAGREDYKQNSDAKVAIAVSAAEKRTLAAAAKSYAEDAKKPLKSYVGPPAFGAISVQYPKTWSSYILEGTNNSSTPVDAYFHPDFVPNIIDNDQSFSLRIQVASQSYDDALSVYGSLAKTGKVTVAPYRLAKVPNVVGSIIQGQISPTKQGTMVILPLRNMTLKIWVDAAQFMPDYNNIILPNISFTP